MAEMNGLPLFAAIERRNSQNSSQFATIEGLREIRCAGPGARIGAVELMASKVTRAASEREFGNTVGKI
jgi:hypothetical protein